MTSAPYRQTVVRGFARDSIEVPPDETFSSEALSLRLMIISVLGATNTPKDTFNKYVNDTLKTVRSLATGGGNRELAAFRIDSVESSIRRNRTEIADALYDNNEDSEINARQETATF